MSYSHNFGGNWTKEKLGAIYGYVSAYHNIFTKSETASWYESSYIDAFAGTGTIALSSAHSDDIFAVQSDDSEETLIAGSAALALQLSPGFKSYVFIDKDSNHISELEKLAASFPEKIYRTHIWQGDANDILQRLCKERDWRKERALVLLDPYGMSVDWITLEDLAKTKACDVMILFPLGQAVNRVLTKQGLPIPSWQDKLTKFFGSSEWRDVLYRQELVETLFGEQIATTKDADLREIEAYFTLRLKSIFCTVSVKPLPLVNSTGCPIFMLYIVSNNPNVRAKAIIERLSNSVLRKKGK